MEKTLNVDTPTHYAVNSHLYAVIFRNHDIFAFPLFLLFMDLQSPWRKGVLYWSGYWDHLFVSQAYGWWAIVPKPSQTLFFGNVIFGWLASNFRATSENNAVWNSDSFFVRDTYLGILPMRARWWSFFFGRRDYYSRGTFARRTWPGMKWSMYTAFLPWLLSHGSWKISVDLSMRGYPKWVILMG